jgi:hypothetical protein
MGITAAATSAVYAPIVATGVTRSLAIARIALAVANGERCGGASQGEEPSTMDSPFPLDLWAGDYITGTVVSNTVVFVVATLGSGVIAALVVVSHDTIQRLWQGRVPIRDYGSGGKAFAEDEDDDLLPLSHRAAEAAAETATKVSQAVANLLLTPTVTAFGVRAVRGPHSATALIVVPFLTVVCFSFAPFVYARVFRAALTFDPTGAEDDAALESSHGGMRKSSSTASRGSSLRRYGSQSPRASRHGSVVRNPPPRGSGAGSNNAASALLPGSATPSATRFIEDVAHSKSNPAAAVSPTGHREGEVSPPAEVPSPEAPEAPQLPLIVRILRWPFVRRGRWILTMAASTQGKPSSPSSASNSGRRKRERLQKPPTENTARAASSSLLNTHTSFAEIPFVSEGAYCVDVTTTGTRGPPLHAGDFGSSSLPSKGQTQHQRNARLHPAPAVVPIGVCAAVTVAAEGVDDYIGSAREFGWIDMAVQGLLGVTVVLAEATSGVEASCMVNAWTAVGLFVAYLAVVAMFRPYRAPFAAALNVLTAVAGVISATVAGITATIASTQGRAAAAALASGAVADVADMMQYVSTVLSIAGFFSLFYSALCFAAQHVPHATDAILRCIFGYEKDPAAPAAAATSRQGSLRSRTDRQRNQYVGTHASAAASQASFRADDDNHDLIRVLGTWNRSASRSRGGSGTSQLLRADAANVAADAAGAPPPLLASDTESRHSQRLLLGDLGAMEPVSDVRAAGQTGGQAPPTYTDSSDEADLRSGGRGTSRHFHYGENDDQVAQEFDPELYERVNYHFSDAEQQRLARELEALLGAPM